MKDVWKITSPDAKFSEDVLYYFRKTLILNDPKSAVVNITADARYKLWINGNMASFGPHKCDQDKRHYNTVDISAFLKDGENELYVEVLQLSAPQEMFKYKHLSSVFRTGNLALLIWGEAETKDGRVEIKTDESWECARDVSTELLIPKYSFFVGTTVHKKANVTLAWKPIKTIDIYDEVMMYGDPVLWDLKPHNLPPQRYDLKPLTYKDVAGNYDFGKLTSGFIRVKAKGKGTLKLIYAECYSVGEGWDMLKDDRADTTKNIEGDFDIIEVDGTVEFETFWFRTFRYIKAEGDVEIISLDVLETGYPLKVEEGCDFGRETDNKLWEICINTLKNCMHETYEDCPYYEQLQYAMDTYFQMIFTMRLTDDIRLVKQGIQDFAASLKAGNITNSRFPSVQPQYIVGFSLYLVYMLDTLEELRGEHEFVKRYLGTIDSIFVAFGDMKRADGLIGKNAFWNFVDWADGWDRGVPPSGLGDAITVYNMMYAYALEKAARLCRVFGRNDTASEYEAEALEIKKLVKEKCYSPEKGLYADTDKQETYSQHPQVWAVLAGLDDIDTQKRILRESISCTAKGGFAFSYLTFRAFEKADVYELSEDLMNQYRRLIDLNCTTVPETPTRNRSECHAWGAVSINEMTTMVLGVKDDREKIVVKPYIKDRSYAKGTVYTKFGKVYVDWKMTDNGFKITVTAENDTEIEIYLPNGELISGKGKVEL